MPLKASVNADGTTTFSESGKDIYTERVTCRACKHIQLDPILSLGDQYLVNFVEEVDLSLPKAPLTLVRCARCGLLQLKHTTNPDLLFKHFWYRTGINETMRNAMKKIVNEGYMFQQEGVWLDIGANDGYLLSEVPNSFVKIACEPAKNLEAELKTIADITISDYFSSRHESLYDDNGVGRCSVVTSAAMFYDVDDPGAFIDDVAKVLTPNGVWINQLNDAPTMMKQNAFDAICHEHLCYYDLGSLNDLYEEHGMTIIGVSYNDVNGGSMRVTARKKREGWGKYPVFQKDVVTHEDAVRFADRVVKWKRKMMGMLHGEPARTWLYGASTKGAVLLQYLGANEYFVGIADRNPVKHGLYMTGSWLKVYPEETMRMDGLQRIMVLPWAFRDEFIERERKTLDDGAVMVFPLPNIETVL